MADKSKAVSKDKIDGCVMSKVADKNQNIIKMDEENGTPKLLSYQMIDHNHNCDEQGSNDEPKNDQLKQNADNSDDHEENGPEVEPKFYAKVDLPVVDTKTLEDDEDVVVNLRARIYRYDTSDEEPEFKERGTGTVKILRHRITKMYRVLMRRDKTLKICANHYITASMKLDKHNGSDKVFLYSTLADFYENQLNPETFAIRFSNAENASIFKKSFDEAVKCAASIATEKPRSTNDDYDDDEDDDEEGDHETTTESSDNDSKDKTVEGKFESEKLASKIENMKITTSKK